MKLFMFPIKNAYIGWWRSLTLGAFIFFISFVMVFSNSFVFSVRGKMQGNISSALSGDIQIRPAASNEQDMLGIGSTNWDETFSIKEPVTSKVNTALHDSSLEYIEHIRINMLLVTESKQEPVIAIGLDPATRFYKESYVLKDGRLLEDNNRWEIVLAQDVAMKLKVKVGDNVATLCQTKDGYIADAEFKVVGIGDIQMLGMFGIDICYIDLDSAMYLSGFGQGEVTDIIAYCSEKDLESQAKKLSAKFNDMSISTIDDKAAADPSKDVRVTTLNNMGGYVMSIIGIIITTLYGFIISLMLVVSILIVNLVLMMGIERYKEIGTMRALGFSRARIVRLFITEILFITATSGLLGFGAGIALMLILGQTGIPAPDKSFEFYMGSILYPVFNPSGIISLAGILFAFSFLASFIPGLKISSLRPADTIREN